MKKVLIIGGYGNFGSHIAKSLATEKNIQLCIAGRNINKASDLIKDLKATNQALPVKLDINANLEDVLQSIQPDIVIHTSGPFQGQNYAVAEACIKYKAHYIDLADGREFVCGINALDEGARRVKRLICTGASSVPCFSSAIIDAHINEFEKLEHIDYAIATAQKTNRGLATTAAILSYTGKAFTTIIDGKETNI